MRPTSSSAYFSRVFKLCAFIAITSFASHTSSAEVYKWVDEHGNTHYTDKKPHNTEAKSIRIQSSKTSQRSSAQQQAQAIDEKAARAIQAQQEIAQEDARNKEIEAKCATIRENLKVINETSRIRLVEDGKTRYLTAEEISAKKARHEEQVQEFCQ